MIDNISILNQLGIKIKTSKFGEQKVKCPKCSHLRKKKAEPCLSVNVEEGWWRCHHCSWKGSVKYYRKETKEDYSIPKVSNFTALSNKMVKYFKERKIKQGTLIRNQITQCDTYMPARNKKVPAIMFNYYRGKELVNIKYRDGNKNFKQEKGAEPILYKLNDVIDTPNIIICEGEIDALSFEEAGILYATSVNMGAPNTNDGNVEKKVECIKNCANVLEDKKKIYIATDSDANGRRLMEELSRRLGRERCYIINYPEDCKDANDVLVKYDSKVLKECYKKAEHYPIEGVFNLDNVKRYMLDNFQNGKPKGLPIGYKVANAHYKLRTSELDIYTGVPGHGKTHFAFQVMINASIIYGWKWGIFSPENYPVGDLYDTLIEMYIGNTSDKESMDRMTIEDYQRGMDFIKDHFFVVYPKEDFSLDSILSKFKYLVLVHGIKGTIIDPFNQLRHDFNGKTEANYLAEILNRIRRFEQINDLKMIVVAHPRVIRKKDDGTYEIPQAYDISGGANWINKADNILCIHRPNPMDFYDTNVDVYVQKIKFQKLTGVPGTFSLSFDRKSSRYLQDGKYPLEELVNINFPKGLDKTEDIPF